MGWGDDLMWLGEASKFHKETGKNVKPDSGWSCLWDHVPFVKSSCAEAITVPTKPNGNRWYIKRWEHDRVIFKPYTPIPATEYVVTEEEKAFAKCALSSIDSSAPIVLINPDSKNTTFSDNKAWPIHHWCSLVEQMIEEGYTVVRNIPPKKTIDSSGKVSYTTPSIKGVIEIETPEIRQALAIASMVDYIVTTEGLLHHFSAAKNISCTVLFGSNPSLSSTGYMMAPHLYSLGKGHSDGCGKTIPCFNCKEAMYSIKPSTVFYEMKMKLIIDNIKARYD